MASLQSEYFPALHAELAECGNCEITLAVCVHAWAETVRSLAHLCSAVTDQKSNYVLPSASCVMPA